MAVESGLTQPLWISLLGMAVTFGALALVMVAMVLLTRLVREARSPAGENAEGTAVDGATGEDDRAPPTSATAGGEADQRTSAGGAAGGDQPGVGPEDGAPAAAAAAVDLELPAGTETAELLAAVVAVAAARQLAQQRHSARVWLRAEPRSLVSPWQLVARGWQMDRWRR